MKNNLKTVLAGVLLLAGSHTYAQEAITIGTSGSGSPYYTNAVGMSRVIQEHTDINATVESVGGSHPSIFALSDDQVDLAVVNSLAAIAGYEGQAPFPNKVNLRIVAQGSNSLRQIFVRKNSAIKTPQDLANATWITDMPANPDIGQISNALMSATNINPDSVNRVRMVSSKEAVHGFESRTIDAATMPASAGAPHVARLFKDGIIEYLPITKEQAHKMEPMLPKGLSIATLPAGTYSNQDEDATVFAIRTLLVADADTPDETIYKVAKALFENGTELGTYHRTAKAWTVANTVDQPPLPLHSGVVRYLKESGAWNESLSAK